MSTANNEGVSPSVIFQEGGVMENEQLGVVFDEQEVVGQVIGEANANASNVCNGPSRQTIWGASLARN